MRELARVRALGVEHRSESRASASLCHAAWIERNGVILGRREMLQSVEVN
jgi:hypothetical protein